MTSTLSAGPGASTRSSRHWTWVARSPTCRCSEPRSTYWVSHPARTAMVGNSEAADIAPAKALGLRTILVAIEDPVPTHTEADALATSLAQALDIITSWSR